MEFKINFPKSNNTNRQKFTLKLDKSSAFLIFSNLFAMIIAILGQWNVSDIIWVYWGQSIIIGFFNVKRILHLKQFSTENFKINNQPVDPTVSTKRHVALFFAVHYGFFHVVYMVFLLAEWSNMSLLDAAGVAVCVIMFIFNHRFSFKYNLEQDLDRKPNIGRIMFFPYIRIIPMHLTIILGGLFAGGSVGALILFLMLKTIADLIMHQIEHNESQWQEPFPFDDENTENKSSAELNEN